MAVPPTIKWQNQAGPDQSLAHGSVRDAFAPGKAALGSEAVAPHFEVVSIFDQFLGKLKESAFAALQRAAQAQKKGSEVLDRSGGAKLDASAASFDAVFIQSFEGNAYPQQQDGGRRYLPRTAAAWHAFYKNVLALGSRLENLFVTLAHTDIELRGSMKSDTLIVDLVFREPAGKSARAMRMPFVQLVSSEDVVRAFAALHPGHRLSPAEKALLGETAEALRLVGSHAPASEADGQGQALLSRVKSNTSESQQRFETLVLAQRQLREVRENEPTIEAKKQARRMQLGDFAPFPIPLFGRFLSPFLPSLHDGAPRRSHFAYWIVTVGTLVVLYLLATRFL